MAKKTVNKKRSGVDPYAQREAEKYDNPIPSREYILNVLADASGPMAYDDIANTLHVSGADGLEALRRRLGAMVRDGQLVRNRTGAFGCADSMDLVRGAVQGHREGYGFVVSKSGGDDLYISARQMRGVFDGDVVLARVSGRGPNGKQEGRIVDVLQRNTQEIVGRFFKESGVAFVVPENPRITQDVFLSGELPPELTPGQYVTVAIDVQPTWRQRPSGRVTEVLGDSMAPGMEIDVAIRTWGIPWRWPDAVEQQVASLCPEVSEADKQGRIDLRHLPLVTIDGEDARDFDDAVYAERKRGGGWRLWVAIADVSHYVSVGSALDDEAIQRGNSVYFPGRVVPMLPEILSNGLCSLNPEVDRLCMVCEMTISAAGRMSSYAFYEAVMHSKARLTYTKVANILADVSADNPLRQQYAALLKPIETLHELYRALRQARDVRGAIDFETTETRIVFAADKKIADIVPVVRNDAHKLIEECMLAANVAAARFLEKHQLAALYRVHQGPKEERLKGLRDYLGGLGLDLSGGDNPTPLDYQHLLQAVAERADASLIQTMMLRSMSQAVYQPENLGHFGLHYPAYTHFTSPIRRYSDLLTHRAIRSIVCSERESKHVKRAPEQRCLPTKTIYPYEMRHLVSFGEQTSMTERRADDATRDVVSWLKCEYLLDRVGEEFPGVVAAVTSFGLFVELKNVYVEGLVHVTNLANDYYRYDAGRQHLMGERTGKIYGLGDELLVRLVGVSLDERKVDLELVDVLSTVRRRKGAGAANHKSAVRDALRDGKLSLAGKKKVKGDKKKSKKTKKAATSGSVNSRKRDRKKVKGR